MKSTIICAVASALAISASANTTLYDFNSAGDLDNDFNASGTRTDKYFEQSGNGIGTIASNGLEVITSGSQGTRVLKTGFDASSSSFTVSMLFEYNPVADQNDGGAGLFVGFGSSNTWDGSFANTGGADDNQFMVGLTGVTGGDRRLVNYNIADGVRTQDIGDSTTLTAGAGNWYRLEIAAANNGDGTYDLTSAVYNVNSSDGSIAGSAIISNLTDNFANPDFSGGASAYAFFGGQGAADNRIGLNFDNFEVTVVPEPGTYGLIAGMLAIGIAVVRRR